MKTCLPARPIRVGTIQSRSKSFAKQDVLGRFVRAKLAAQLVETALQLNPPFDRLIAVHRLGNQALDEAPGYTTQLHVFEQSNDEIIRQARKHNVEGAALAFTQLTISCVNCHKQLRESK